jgi:Uma2 family endonuclease
MTQTTQPRLTLEEFLSYDDGTHTRYELVDGVLVEMGAESTLNTIIAGFLFAAFLQLGIPSYRIGFKQWIAISSSLATARDPDLIVHSEDSFAAIDGATQALIPATVQAPLLIVEIVSPGNLNSDNYQRDYIEKRQEYAVRGIPEYWLVDPERAVILVLTLQGQSYQGQEFRESDRILSDLFPNFPFTASQVLNAGR